MDDGHTMTPEEIYNYLCRVLYNRRNKMDPLWNSLVVGGVSKVPMKSLDPSHAKLLALLAM